MRDALEVGARPKSGNWKIERSFDKWRQIEDVEMKEVQQDGCSIRA